MPQRTPPWRLYIRIRCCRNLVRELLRRVEIRRARADLLAMDARELLDLCLDRGGIEHALRHGRRG